MQPGSKFVSVSCDLCGGTVHELLFVKEGFRHVRCNECGLVFVNPRLAEHLDMQSRSGTGSMGEDRLTSSQDRRLRKAVAGLGPYRKLNRVLEIGPGRGWFLRECSRQGWETWAVEVNADAIRHLSAQPVTRLVREPAEEFHAPAQSADVVRIWDVIEHLQSPKKAMTNVYRALRSGGILSLATTNFDSLSRRVNGPEWVYLNGSDHIVLFEPETIRHLLESVGFTRIRIRTRSFNLRRKLYYPERDLPPSIPYLRPFRKIIDELIGFTGYGHQMIVTAIRP